MAMQSGFIKRIRDIMRMDAGINGDAQRIEQMVWMLFLKVYDAKEDDWELSEDNYESIIPEACRWRNWAKADCNGQAMTGDKLLDFVNNVLFPVLKGNDVKKGDTVLYEGIRVTPDTPIKKAIVKSTFEDANNYMKDGVYLRQVINVIDEIEFDDVKESHAFGFVYEEILRELQAAGSSGEFYTPRAVTDFMAQMIRPQLGEKMADFACGTGGFITSWLGQLSKQVTDVSQQNQLDESIYGIEKKPFPYLLCVTNMLLHDIEVPQIYHTNSLRHNLLDYTEEDQFDVILMNPPYGGHEDKSIQGFFPDDLASSETADLFLSVIMYRLKKNGRAAVILPDGFLFGTDNAKVNIKKKLLSEFNLHTVIRLPGSVFAPYTSITTNLLFFDNTGKTEETWFYRLDMPEGYKHFSKTKPMKLEHFAPVVEWWDDRRELTVDGFDKAKKYTYQQLTQEMGYDLNLCGYPREEEEILDPMDLIQRYQEERASLNAIVDRAVAHINSQISGGSETISTDFAKGALTRLATIDGRFADDMQKSLLQMAIQGKLVEQRPEEGTGEELYQQIQAEKQALIKAGKIKKDKPLPEITEDEKPFDIPEGWKWVRLGEIVARNPKNDIDDETDVGFIPMPCVSDGYRNHHTYEIRKWREIKKGFTHFATGDIGVAKITPCFQNRKSVIFKGLPNGYGAGTTELSVIRIYRESMQREYILCFLKSEYFIRNGMKSFTGTAGQQRIHKDYLATCLFPLPPLAEQKRIVAKLDELLPLCEKLK
jgi:type I restriction enzyme M protein